MNYRQLPLGNTIIHCGLIDPYTELKIAFRCVFALEARAKQKRVMQKHTQFLNMLYAHLFNEGHKFNRDAVLKEIDLFNADKKKTDNTIIDQILNKHAFPFEEIRIARSKHEICFVGSDCFTKVSFRRIENAICHFKNSLTPNRKCENSIDKVRA